MYQSVIGPDNCTSFGDPFSPLTSLWEPGIYTYTYRIRIPSEYMAAHDILRIELLDPDSWTDRSNGNYAIITHTETAVALGYPSTEKATAEWNPALFDNAFIDTVESDVIGGNLNGLSVTAEMINPVWFLRLESHFGECSAPFSYDPANNNVTRYELYYYRDNGDTVERVDLSAYTGSVIPLTGMAFSPPHFIMETLLHTISIRLSAQDRAWTGMGYGLLPSLHKKSGSHFGCWRQMGIIRGKRPLRTTTTPITQLTGIILFISLFS